MLEVFFIRCFGTYKGTKIVLKPLFYKFKGGNLIDSHFFSSFKFVVRKQCISYFLKHKSKLKTSS